MLVSNGPAVASAANAVPVVWSFSSADLAAAGLVLIGLICQLSHRRLARALGTSLFGAALTAAAIVLALDHGHSTLGYLHLTSRTVSIASALWAFFGWLTSGNSIDNPRRLLPTTSAVFFAWSLVCGMAAAVLLIFVMVFATWSRVLDPDSLIERLTSAGAMDLLALIIAALFWRAAVSRPHQPVVLLVLLALLVWWSSLMIPSGVGSLELAGRLPGGMRGLIVAYQPAWWTWTFHMQFGFAVLLVSAAVMQEWRYRARRRRAWPDRLDDLLEPYSRWPAYIQVEAIIAAAILIVGVYQIVRPYPTAWQLNLANFLVSLAAGITCLFLIYRRWSGNTAGLGVALVTLAAVALACLVAIALSPLERSADYARRIPILDNAVLSALALAIVFWSWLTGFWHQQLDHGRPWTTTGRMIPFARRAAFLLSALAALVAFRMALWPRQVLANINDGSPGRLAAGLAAVLLLAWLTGRKARKEDSTADATFSVAFVLAAMVFLFVRIAPSSRRDWGWLIQYETVVLGFACLPILVAAELLTKTRWRSFSTPLWLLALLILPMRVLILLLPSNRLPAEWVRPMVLAILGAVYSFAGSRESRRAILVLGGVLLLAALTTFYRSYGKIIMP
jgi:hypothetical protein